MKRSNKRHQRKRPTGEVLARPLSKFLRRVSKRYAVALSARPADIAAAKDRKARVEAEAQRLHGLGIPTPKVFSAILQEAGKHLAHAGDLLDPVAGLAALRDDWEIRGYVGKLNRRILGVLDLVVELAQEMREVTGP